MESTWNNYCNRKPSSVLGKNSSSPPEVFLQISVLQTWTIFTGEHPCTSAISMKLHNNLIEITLLQWSSPVKLLHSCRQLFRRTPLGDCFCKSNKSIKLKINKYQLNYKRLHSKILFSLCLHWICHNIYRY